jgi:hypothetical protein
MTDNEIVDSSFTATIDAPIERIDLPEWCFTLSEKEYQECSPRTYRGRIHDHARRQANVDQCRGHRRQPDGPALRGDPGSQRSPDTGIGFRHLHSYGQNHDPRSLGDECQSHRLRWTRERDRRGGGLSESPAKILCRSDTRHRGAVTVTIPFDPSLLNPLLMVVPVGMWSKAQPVGEADRPHIHRYCAS